MRRSSRDLLKTIRRIQIHSDQLAKDLLAGAYHSAFKGKGIEFEEVREYQPGDETRSIDWNVTARMNHPYVKNFKEERELTVLLVVDISSSLRFGSKYPMKSDLIAEIGATIAFSAIKNNDKIGLILFSESVEKYLPPKKGVKHVLRVIRDLLTFEPKGKSTHLNAALSFLGNVQKKSGICFLISDFLSDEDHSQEMSLIAKKHDLITIGLIDPCETALPQMNLVNFMDLETQEIQLVDTSASELQKKFQENTQFRLKEHQKLMKRIGAGYIEIHTDKPYLPPLRNFFKRREKKR